MYKKVAQRLLENGGLFLTTRALKSVMDFGAFCICFYPDKNYLLLSTTEFTEHKHDAPPLHTITQLYKLDKWIRTISHY